MRSFDKLDINELLSRQDYLVVQSNDLAKAFGNLKAFEHKILDYCISFVTKESLATETFTVEIANILKQFCLNGSGQNYQRIAKAFKTLNENTALYFSGVRENGKKFIRMGQLFKFIDIEEDGKIVFQFSEIAAPYIFELQKNYYSFKLRELSQIKSKYTLIMLKLIEANRYKNNTEITIAGTVDEFKDWFLGKEKGETWTTARFSQQVLTVALKEIEMKLPNVSCALIRLKKGKKTTGYEIRISDYRNTR